MGNRLSKLATKTGDDGTTGIGGNQRLDKDSARIEAIGTVDELNASIGMVLSHLPEVKVNDESADIPIGSGVNTTTKIVNVLSDIQHRLFDLGGELAMPGYVLVEEHHLNQLDEWLEAFNAMLPPLKEFVLPKGSIATTCSHLARTICRRAERRVITLSKTDDINLFGCIYLNRLSDLLFVFCRLLGRENQGEEEMWQSKRAKS